MSSCKMGAPEELSVLHSRETTTDIQISSAIDMYDKRPMFLTDLSDRHFYNSLKMIETMYRND